MAAVAAKLQVLVACALLLLAVGCQASPFWPLEIGYYHDKCPQAEAVVKGVMEKAVSQNPGNGAAMIRMLFHDCFVEGCDASVLLDPTPFSPTPEKLSPPNDPTLRGFELIDAIKDALEGPAAATPGGNDPTVMQDVVTPNRLDRQYYKNVLSHTVLFTSDAALMTSAETARMVVENAKIPGWWEDRFEKAMVKMAGIEVKTGYQGQIRKNCRAINHY
ncbi:Peroxidase 2 [Triticum urartu]|uniref:Peroxidase 2 n=1 Tax=Triticum urartu TaxID=4572 RepID=M7Z8A6_TRIUA|nr:Peroxidase 2 [Triticum urartu]